MLYCADGTQVNKAVIEDIVPTDTETQVFEFIFAIQDGDFDKSDGHNKYTAGSRGQAVYDT